jgi:protein associated with RNAse G/E
VNARVRGIYATALTRLLLDADHTVVDASPPIRRRFDADFPAGPPDLTVETTDDRQGVGVRGPEAAVTATRDRFTEVAADAMAWTDPTPSGAVFDAEVTATGERGAVVALGGTTDHEGFLPYRNVGPRVETGDVVCAQVRTSVPPWAENRPTLGTGVRVDAGLVTLEPGAGTRVDARDDEAARELAGMLDLLGIEPPSGWRAVWAPAALEADAEALEHAVDRATDEAARLTAAIDDASSAADPGAVTGVRDDGATAREGALARPHTGAWIWFGRESRFALDEVRRRVTTTMPGHHRIKAGTASASTGVDFAEAVCDPDGDAAFPFAAVRAGFGPTVGDALRIEHGKPDGRRITLGEGTVTAIDDRTVTVEREMSPGGRYDGLDTPRRTGDVAVTKLAEGRWWYPTTYRGADGTVRGTYVNVCTPVEVFPKAARYVDLHVDVIKHPDGRVERVDDAELDASVDAGDTPPALADRARSVAAALENAL